MSDKRFKTRIVQKHAIESDWAKAVNFTPLKGETIVYDIDDNYNYERMKIGDGERNVNDLPFVTDVCNAIIDVVELPTENIKENAFYRLTNVIARFVYNKNFLDEYTCYCVTGLPQIGIPVTNSDMSTMVAYYNIENGSVSGYIDEALSTDLGAPSGWYDLSELMATTGNIFGGVVTDISEAIDDGAIRLFVSMEYDSCFYTYKNAWTKIIIAQSTLPKYNIHWDGDIGKYPFVDVSALVNGEAYLIKFSDYVATEEELVGSVLKMSNEDERVIQSDNLDRSLPGSIGVCSDGLLVIQSSDEFTSAIGIEQSLITNGLYFVFVVDSDFYLEYFITPCETMKINSEYLAITGAGRCVEGLDFNGIVADEGAEVFNSDNNIATGKYSHAEGYDSNAPGLTSHAEGWSTTANGESAHAEGYKTTASGNRSHAEGGFTTASGAHSHAEGDRTTASSNCAHAEGYGTTASGDHSHAEGDNTKASASYSHAEGKGTTASGSCSHAEGEGTNASGANSHAEGYATTASGHYSHAEGEHTTASRRSQHVQGEYNIEDTEGADMNSRGKYAHIVGNGTYNGKRSNAHTLDWDGNGWFQGAVYVGGSGQDDPNAKELATTEYVDASVSNVGKNDLGVYVQAQEPTEAVAGDIWIDTANDPTYIPPRIPEVTEADNGKVLMVVGGKLQLVNLNLSIDANGVVSM